MVALDSHVTSPSRPGWYGQALAMRRDVLIAAATTVAAILLTCGLIAIITLLAIFMTDQSPMKKPKPNSYTNIDATAAPLSRNKVEDHGDLVPVSLTW